MEEFQELYPIRTCEYEMKDDLAVVLFKNEKESFIERIFFKKLKDQVYKIDLDEYGTFVYLLCDGERSIKSIIEKAEEKFGERIKPADKRIELFIKQMQKNKLVKLYYKS